MCVIAIRIRNFIVVSISAYHAEDPVSIPGRGVIVLALCNCAYITLMHDASNEQRTQTTALENEKRNQTPAFEHDGNNSSMVRNVAAPLQVAS